MTDAAKVEQTRVNDSGTIASADTRLTRGDSRPVLYELIDKDGNRVGLPFMFAQQAALEANRLWPDQPQDPDRLGFGWNVQVVGAE